MESICFCGAVIRPVSRDWEPGEPFPAGPAQMWCQNPACSEYKVPILPMPRYIDPSLN